MTAPKKAPPQAVFKTKTKAEKVADALAQALKDAAVPKHGTKPGKPAGKVASQTTPKSESKPKAKPASSAAQQGASKGPAKAVRTAPDVQPDLDAMLQGLLKSTPRLADAGADAAGQRCGLVAIVGKPNVGKSTLLNALVGQKISITSRKAQTTRHRITGMRTQGTTQFVFVDTPGFQTIHGNALNKSLNKTVQGAVSDVDLILLVVEAGSFTPADARVLSLLGKDIPTILVANKLDNVHRRGDIAPWLQEMQTKHAFAEFMPMSAKNPKDVERLLGICEGFLPEQAWWYSEDELTDRSEKFLASELVREKLFRLTGDELPYTSTVVIDKFEEEPPQKKGQKRLLRIAATIVVERDGHKAMVIGDKGERIKRIGMETRVELEKLADAKVFLELWVKVRSGWADDEARVRSFGYE